jgi:prepilin-type N-terminal cleavage/methylation domain-containing protein
MKMHDEEIINSYLSCRLRQCAFTLIELLIVIAIILVLSGLTLKVMSMVGNKAGVSKTIMVLEQVKNALASYYSTYGSYPLVNGVGAQVAYNQPPTLQINTNVSKGLISYLLAGKLQQNPPYPALTLSCLNPEAEKWEHYLKGLYSTRMVTNSSLQNQSMMDYTNMAFTIQDAWDHDIRYTPQPDGQGYTLSSDGPTGVTNDDIYVTYQ